MQILECLCNGFSVFVADFPPWVPLPANGGGFRSDPALAGHRHQIRIPTAVSFPPTFIIVITLCFI